MIARWTASAAVAVCVGCAPTGTGTGDADGGPGGATDGGAGGAQAIFDVERRELTDAAPLSAAALAIALRADGRFAVAYAVAGQGTFDCETLTGGTVEGGDNVDVVVLDETADGALRVRTVDTVPGIKQGSIDLAVDPVSDALIVAYAGGEPANGYCGASDLVVAVEDGDAFTTTVVLTGSATGATCRYVEDPFCEIGDTTGLYPGVVVDQDGTIAVAFQDLHNGFADKDLYGADLELARGAQASSLALATVSAEVGGGYFSSVAFAADGRVVLGHAILASNQFPDGQGGTYTMDDGIWAAVEQSDGTFRESLLARGQATDGRVAVAHHPQGGHVAAYHDRGSDDVYLYTSRDDGLTWTADPVDQIGRTGRDPAVGFLSDGRLVVAYGFCGGGTGDACVRDQDGVKVAVRDGAAWTRQLLDGDDEDLEGKDVDMAIRAVGGDDVVAIASLVTSKGLIVVHRLTPRTP